MPIPDATAPGLSGDLLNMKCPGRDGVEREFTWPEVKQIVAAERMDLLGRTAEQERVYSECMSEFCKEYGSVVSYILQVKLATFIADKTSEFLVLPNDFPYALAPDMSHYIVWSKQKLTAGVVPDLAIKQLIDAYLDEQIGAGLHEWAWFVNPVHLQSIPEAAHGHLIVKRL